MAGKRFFFAGQAQFVAYQVHQIGRVFAIMDGKAHIQPDLRRVFAQQARADAMESARPIQFDLRQPRVRIADLAHDALGPARHFFGAATREGEQQN